MKNILSLSGREVVQEYAWSNVLLGFDFDGTLAPIVSDPLRAKIAPPTRRRLRQLVDRYPCVVVSGRSRADVARRLWGTGVGAVLGNHGLEPWLAPPSTTEIVHAWRRALDGPLAEVPGVVIEDKGFSLAVHYRRSRAKKVARVAIIEAARKLAGVRVLGGKQVVNLVPQGAGHKGIALLKERDRAGCDTALFVGDDDTDEDVFALDQPGRLLSIRVGRKGGSQAAYFLPRRGDIDELMRVLIEARSRSPGRSWDK